ncbi:MAG: hypothetical protein ACLSVD_12060 [Eggerthellaceae bacterium]
MLILLARTRESVLPTILSRCQVVPFHHSGKSTQCAEHGRAREQARMAVEARALPIRVSPSRTSAWRSAPAC